ncbi:MAG: hypothetical protein ABL901_11755 [Hyphomicrobiaceae bacterium]
MAIACAQAQAEAEADAAAAAAPMTSCTLAAGTRNIDLDQGASNAATLLIDERAARPGVISRLLAWWTALMPAQGPAGHSR